MNDPNWMEKAFLPGGGEPQPNNRWEKTTARAQVSLKEAAPDDAESFIEVKEQDGRILVNADIRPPFGMGEFCQAIWHALDTLYQANGKGHAHISRDDGTYRDTG